MKATSCVLQTGGWSCCWRGSFRIFVFCGESWSWPSWPWWSHLWWCRLVSKSMLSGNDGELGQFGEDIPFACLTDKSVRWGGKLFFGKRGSLCAILIVTRCNECNGAVICAFCDKDGSTSKFSSSLERLNVVNGVCCPSQKSHARPTIREYYCKHVCADHESNVICFASYSLRISYRDVKNP